jgi:hypothetical protein
MVSVLGKFFVQAKKKRTKNPSLAPPHGEILETYSTLRHPCHLVDFPAKLSKMRNNNKNLKGRQSHESREGSGWRKRNVINALASYS